MLVELGSALCATGDRHLFAPYARHLSADAGTLIIPASGALFDAGLALFADRPDKNWSMVDCISFVVMKKHRLKDALTADHHFQQAGFRALLREGVGR